MANNITAPGAGEVLATEEISGAHLSRVKLALGALGTDGGDVSSANPIPITASSNVPVALGAALPAGTNNIGDVDVASLPALPAGTNNIGDVDVVTLPSLPAGTNNIGDVDVASLPALPAGTNMIGRVAASLDLGNVLNGTAAAVIGRVTTIVTTASANTLHTPGSGKKARVLAMLITPLGTANSAYVFLGTTNDKLGDSTNKIAFDKTGAAGLPGLLLPYNPVGWFEGAADEALKITPENTQPLLVLAQVVDI